MEIVPFKKRDASNVVLSVIIAVVSIILSVVMWMLVAGGGEYLIVLIAVAMLPTFTGLMSLMSLITGKPWYLEALVATALLH